MANVYFWCGKGGLKIDRIYTTGEKIPHTKMDKGTLAKLIKDGDIKTSPFNTVEDSSELSRLQKQVKDLSEQLAGKNKEADDIEAPLKETIQGLERVVAENGTKITELEGELKTSAERIVELEKQVEDLTEPKED